MQTPTGPSSTPGAPALLESISWFDWTAIAVVAVFLVLGVFKGLRWQVGRLAVLVAAYAVAIAFGDTVATAISGWFANAGDGALPGHVARTLLFVAVLVVVGIVIWIGQRFFEARPTTAVERLLGGAVGALCGALAVLALLTGMHMFFGQRGIARATESSTAAEVGGRALGFAERVLPGDLAAGARDWRVLLLDPRAAAEPEAGRDGGPGSPPPAGGPAGDGRSAGGEAGDPGGAVPPPGKRLDPRRAPADGGR